MDPSRPRATTAMHTRAAGDESAKDGMRGLGRRAEKNGQRSSTSSQRSITPAVSHSVVSNGAFPDGQLTQGVVLGSAGVSAVPGTRRRWRWESGGLSWCYLYTGARVDKAWQLVEMVDWLKSSAKPGLADESA